MTASAKARALLQLIRFDKPIGSILLLWPTLWALWIAAEGVPPVELLIIFVLGTFLMRSAGCIVNDLADRELDGAVERTRDRPLVTGAVTVTEARILFFCLLLLAFALVLLTNPLTIMLSVVGVVLASTYPLMKRYTHLPQVLLGAAFSWGIPMAFAAHLDALPPTLWLLYAANLLWTVVYDTQYAMVDREDDLGIGIKSTAILFGKYDRLAIACLQLASLLALYVAGHQFGLGPAYYGAMAVTAVLFMWQQYLISHREPADCFRAFINNRWVGGVVWLGIAIHYAPS